MKYVLEGRTYLPKTLQQSTKMGLSSKHLSGQVLIYVFEIAIDGGII